MILTAERREHETGFDFNSAFLVSVTLAIDYSFSLPLGPSLPTIESSIFWTFPKRILLSLQFVCMGGTPKRMEQFANYIMKEIGHKLPAGTTLLDITQNSYRYSMYKVGPVLSISVSLLRFGAERRETTRNVLLRLPLLCILIAV